MFREFKRLLLGQGRLGILDLGCGCKPWSRLLCDCNATYVGIDFDQKMSFADAVASAGSLPFPDNSFNAIICSEVLEHVTDLPRTLEEMRRVAQNGALIYISSPFVFPEHGAPYDFLRLSRYFYRRYFKAGEIVLLRESNSSLSTAIVSPKLFLESSPFRILYGIKQMIYSATNLTAVIVEALTRFLLAGAPVGLRNEFYSMPLGYALIVRIQK